jgi:hypothetical protein
MTLNHVENGTANISPNRVKRKDNALDFALPRSVRPNYQ